MSRQPSPSPAQSPRRSIRIEYLGSEDVDAYREFKFRVARSAGSSELRFRIATEAFDAGRIRPQDGPDICYQKLLRAIAVDEAPAHQVTTINDLDLVTYRSGHTSGSRLRWSREPLAPTPPVAAPVTGDIQPRLQEGQRVNHAVFGMGVTTASTRTHTMVRFDRDGSKTFVSSMLQLEVLSAPRTWETSPRGANRPCKTTAAS